MLSLYLLTVVGLVVVAATDPHDFSRLCSSPAPGGECPAGWRNVGGDCLKFMSGWDQAKAKEVCREEGAEYSEYLLMSEYSDSAAQHLLPVCLVRRETQCQCGRTNIETQTVGGVETEEKEYPWEVRLSTSRDPNTTCGGSIINRDEILTAANCTEGHSVESINVFTKADEELLERVDGEVSHSVCSKREHPDEDIAVLNLCKPLMFSKAVGPVCLPEPVQEKLATLTTSVPATEGSNVNVNEVGGGECNVTCAELFLPVCGSNGITYNNTCLLKLDSCLRNINIQVDHVGDCPLDLELNESLTPTEPPRRDEGSGWGYSYDEIFPAQENDCTQKCDGLEHDPVCGDDGITYDNLCQLNTGHCRSDRGVKLLHRGECLQCDKHMEWMCDRDNFCINMTQICDGQIDCPDASDENFCTWDCWDGGRVEAEKHCNGVPDCPDGSDENDCAVQPNSCDLHHQYRCDSGDCIDRSQLCDGDEDCPAGDDEEYCQEDEAEVYYDTDDVTSQSEDDFFSEDPWDSRF